jgi:hypothetical protein
MSENGKGSKRRPSLVSKEIWEINYNRIFKKKNDKLNESKRK